TRDVALPSWGAGVDGTLLCGRRGAPIRPETVPPDRRPAVRGRRPLRGPAHDPRAGAQEAHGGTDGGRTRHGRAPRPAGAPAPAPGRAPLSPDAPPIRVHRRPTCRQTTYILR